MSTPSTFAFRIPPDLMTRLRTVSHTEKISAGEIIRRGVIAELDRIAVTRLARDLEKRAS